MRVDGGGRFRYTLPRKRSFSLPYYSDAIISQTYEL